MIYHVKKHKIIGYYKVQPCFVKKIEFYWKNHLPTTKSSIFNIILAVSVANLTIDILTNAGYIIFLSFISAISLFITSKPTYYPLLISANYSLNTFSAFIPAFSANIYVIIPNALPYAYKAKSLDSIPIYYTF